MIELQPVRCHPVWHVIELQPARCHPVWHVIELQPVRCHPVWHVIELQSIEMSFRVTRDWVVASEMSSSVTRDWVVIQRWCYITCVTHSVRFVRELIIIIITRWLLRRHNMESNSRAPALEVIRGGLTPPHWLRTTPLLVTVKFGLGVGFDPSERSEI